MSEDKEQLEEFAKELKEEKVKYCVGPDGCVYRVIDLSESAFDKRYEQR